MRLPIRLWRQGPVFVLLLAAAVSSCSRERRPTVHPVHGTVTVQNKPAAKAVLVLRPASQGPLKGPIPHGEVGPDGAFQISTYAEGDGAPEGEYIVTITWPESRKDPMTGDEVSDDRLQGRYADPATSSWKITIRAGDNELAPFRLD
jgi:hypothetical protein